MQQLIAKFSQGPKYQLVPNDLSRTNVGISVKEPFAPGWSFLAYLNTNFSPYSLQIGNGPRSLVDNNAATLGNQKTSTASGVPS